MRYVYPRIINGILRQSRLSDIDAVRLRGPLRAEHVVHTLHGIVIVQQLHAFRFKAQLAAPASVLPLRHAMRLHAAISVFHVDKQFVGARSHVVYIE